MFIKKLNYSLIYRKFSTHLLDGQNLSLKADVEAAKAKQLKSDIPVNNLKREQNYQLGQDFFAVPCFELAKNLLGQILVRQLDDERHLKCRIVETEAYPGGDDKASHTHLLNTPTKKTKSTFMSAGTACVTSVYGVHLVLSISSIEKGASVLIRSAEPISGAEEMRRLRAIYLQKDNAKPLLVNKYIRWHRLCAGPGRLAAALGIVSQLDGHDLTVYDTLWLEQGPEDIIESDIVECPRVGLSKSLGTWAHKPYRYYILGHTSVSRRNKALEKKLLIETGVISQNGKRYLK